MGDDGYGPLAFSVQLFGHGFPDCVGEIVHLRPVIIRPYERPKVGTIDRPKPAVPKDLIDLIQKEMSHVDLVLQVVLFGRFAVMADLPKIKGTLHSSSLPKDWHTRKALLSPSS